MSDWSMQDAASPALPALSPPWPSATADSRPGFRSGDFAVFVADEIAACTAHWPDLSGMEAPGSTAAYPFQCRDHLLAWQETIAAAKQIRPVFVSVSRKNGDPLMLVPFCIKKERGLKILTFPDQAEADYNAPVVFPAAAGLSPAAMAGIWKMIRHALPSFDLAQLEKMPERVGEMKNPFHALAQAPMTTVGRCLVLSDPHLSVRNSRRRRRRLSRLGALQFGFAEGQKEIAEVLEAFDRQLSCGGTKRSHYHRKLAQDPASGARLFYLRVGPDIIATAWCLIAGERLYYGKAASDGGVWRSYSPSWLLLEELLRWASQNGITHFDLGSSGDSYRQKWQGESLPLWSAVYPGSLTGWICHTAGKLVQSWKKSPP